MFSSRTMGRFLAKIVLLFLLLFVVTGCNSRQTGNKLKVVTGTSLLMTAVQEVGRTGWK